MNATDTITIERQLFQNINPGHNRERLARFVGRFGEELRIIIDTFETMNGRGPTIDDILARLQDRCHINPREEMEKDAA